MVDWFNVWPGLCPEIRVRRGWNTLFFALLWSIWEARNQIIFKGNQTPMTQVADLVKGKVHCLFSEFVGVSDSITVELLAIHKAVSLCSSPSFFHDKEVIFISDSKAAVSWINAEGIRSLTYVHLIYDIRNVLNNLWNARVVFNSKSSNSFRDSLAKMGSSKEGDRLIWDLC
ncbi:hypothetical protein Dsin_011788 [Dipteronia sinensis]|uniref:RNase H type-1 domain-containing protein n=1 Tax=Dipteronia sinensis TaxID=43782 RepID=A0AAE0AH95_9ROSI|nr:hypothetical protein Dsin_011788 [Dipteronia sinensis]